MNPPNRDENTIRRIADYERLSSIFWIVLGCIQICFLWTAIAGCWNIVAAITRWKLPERIRHRDPEIPKQYQGVAQLVIIGVVNLILGGFIGVLFVGFDFFIRDKVLTNEHLFTGAAAVPMAAGDTEVTGHTNVAHDFSAQLRQLAKLRDDGIISPEDFQHKKDQLLGI